MVGNHINMACGLDGCFDGLSWLSLDSLWNGDMFQERIGSVTLLARCLHLRALLVMACLSGLLKFGLRYFVAIEAIA